MAPPAAARAAAAAVDGAWALGLQALLPKIGPRCRCLPQKWAPAYAQLALAAAHGAATAAGGPASCNASPHPSAASTMHALALAAAALAAAISHLEAAQAAAAAAAVAAVAAPVGGAVARERAEIRARAVPHPRSAAAHPAEMRRAAGCCCGPEEKAANWEHWDLAAAPACCSGVLVV